MGTTRMAHFTLAGEKPMEYVETGDDGPDLSSEQQQMVDRVGTAIAAYLNASESLLNGKYTQLKDVAPAHLASPGNVIISCGTDGVLVRYDPRVEKTDIRITWRTEPLSEAVDIWSQHLIRCRSVGEIEPPDDAGVPFSMQFSRADGSHPVNLFETRLVYNATLAPPEAPPRPPMKPFFICSVRNSLTIQI